MNKEPCFRSCDIMINFFSLDTSSCKYFPPCTYPYFYGTCLNAKAARTFAFWLTTSYNKNLMIEMLKTCWLGQDLFFLLEVGRLLTFQDTNEISKKENY